MRNINFVKLAITFEAARLQREKLKERVNYAAEVLFEVNNMLKYFASIDIAPEEDFDWCYEQEEELDKILTNLKMIRGKISQPRETLVALIEIENEIEKLKLLKDKISEWMEDKRIM